MSVPDARAPTASGNELERRIDVPTSDIEQDIIDVFVIPVLAMITYRIDFFTWVRFASPFLCMYHSQREDGGCLRSLSGYAQLILSTRKHWAILACVRWYQRPSRRLSSNHSGSNLILRTMIYITEMDGARASSELNYPAQIR